MSEFSQIWPIENINTIHLDKLNEIMEKLRKFVPLPDSGIQNMQSKTCKRLAYFDNEFIQVSYQKNEDYEKSCVIWDVLQATKNQIPPIGWDALIKELPLHAEFIGPNTQYIRKILESKTWSRNSKIQDQVEEFLEIFYQKLETCEKLKNPYPKTDDIVIGTASAGGAHTTIARNAQFALKDLGYHAHIVDEAKLYDTDDDPLKACIGLAYSQCYNVVEQHHGSREYSLKLKRLAKLLMHYIPPKRNEMLRKEVKGARFFYSTSHHAYNIRLITESVEKICFQICDFGEVSLKLRRLLETVIEYDLPNIYFLAPSDSTFIHFKGERLGFQPPLDTPYQATFNRVMRLFGYPINPLCYSISSSSEKDGVFNELKALGYPIRNTSHLVVMVMGKQGVTNILDKYVRDIQNIYQSKKDLDVLVVCGNNKELKEQMTKLALKTSSDRVSVIPTGRIENDLLVRIGKHFDVYLTKPGGATIAEGIYGRFSLFLHRNPTSYWEFGNIEEAKKRVNAVEIEEDLFAIQMETRLDNPPEKKEVEQELPIPQMTALLNLFDMPELFQNAA